MIWRRLRGAVGLALLAVSVAQAQSVEPPPDTGGPIPLAEIAARAAETRSLLENQDATLTESREVQAIIDALPAAVAELRARLDETRAQLDANPPLPALEQIAASWETTRAKVRAWSELVTQATTHVEQERTRLARLRESWQRTREAAASAGAPQVVLDQIDGILSALNAVRARMEERFSALVVVQYRLVELQRRADEALARIAQVRADHLRRLGVRDGPPLWSRALWAGALDQASAVARDLGAAARAVATEVAQQHTTRLPLHALFFLLLVALLWRGRRVARRWSEDEPRIGSVARVFSRPISSALVLACVAAPWIYSDATPLLMRLVTILAIVPVVRLIRPSMDRSFAPALYVFGVLFLADGIRSVVATAPLFEHMVFLGEMLVAGAVMLWVSAARRRLVPALLETDPLEARALRYVGRLLLAAYVGAFGLAAVGYVELARLIGGGALGSAYYGLAILAGVQVAKGLGDMLLRSRPLGLLASVQQTRARLERRLIRVLRWAGVLIWIAATLDALTLSSGVTAAVLAILTAQWGWGAIRISLGDLLVFALTVWLSFVLASAVRIVLAEDVFPRVHMGRGLPLTVSILVQYTVILGGFTLALAALGVDLTKLTILAGAFGVGAGLGLQNLVNNFASGLILLFERPIHVGDAVQIGAVGGEVRRIGARATVVRTADGAEVFIPNSQLIAQTVTNWTYSDLRRRIVLPVRVAYGAVPQRVTELLTGVAVRHQQVLDQPAPAAVFMGFGDHSLDFELRAWTDRFGNAETIQSQLADAVYAALTEARIELPVPRRDVRVWTVDDGRKEA